MHDLLYQVHCQCEATYNTGSRHKYLTEPNRKKEKKAQTDKQSNGFTGGRKKNHVFASMLSVR